MERKIKERRKERKRRKGRRRKERRKEERTGLLLDLQLLINMIMCLSKEEIQRDIGLQNVFVFVYTLSTAGSLTDFKK